MRLTPIIGGENPEIVQHEAKRVRHHRRPAHEAFNPPKPNVAETELLRWWQKRESVRDALSQNDLWALAKADHPEHTVARDRIRALAENRKPGPKGS